MTRVSFKKDDQINFFHLIKTASNLSTDQLGTIVNISGRSFRDWANGTTLPTQKGIITLSNKYQVEVPKIQAILEEHWTGRIYGRKAALVCNQLYGPPGTPLGRSVGGKVSQQRRKQYPEYYRTLGCSVANNFPFPKPSPELAEFVGIVLGDGGLTSKQCQITLDLHKDADYSQYVKRLISFLFSYDVTILKRESFNARVLVITGENLIKILIHYGLLVGNKIENQVNIPAWITQNPSYFTACIRGLYDTDGGTFTHKHITQGYRYTHFGITFTNASIPLLNSFRQYLTINGIKSGLSGINILVYNKPGIKKFFALVNPHNQKHIKRFNQYIQN